MKLRTWTITLGLLAAGCDEREDAEQDLAVDAGADGGDREPRPVASPGHAPDASRGTADAAAPGVPTGSAAATLDGMLDAVNKLAVAACSCEGDFYDSEDECLKDNGYVRETERRCMQRVLVDYPSAQTFLRCEQAWLEELLRCMGPSAACDDEQTSDRCDAQAEISWFSCRRSASERSGYQANVEVQCYGGGAPVVVPADPASPAMRAALADLDTIFSEQNAQAQHYCQCDRGRNPPSYASEAECLHESGYAAPEVVTCVKEVMLEFPHLASSNTCHAERARATTACLRASAECLDPESSAYDCPGAGDSCPVPDELAEGRFKDELEVRCFPEDW